MTVTNIQNRSVLVLGGLGFLGRALTARLVTGGARVTVLTPLREHHAAAAELLERDGVRVVEGDVRNAALIQDLIRNQDAVANLAGRSGAVRSMEDPWTDLDVNVRGTLVVLEALRELNRDAIYLCVGSRLEYGRPTALPVAEDALGEPLCLHAVHKRTIEEYLALYHRLFGLRYVVARVTNPYGPGQPHGRTAYGIVNRLIQLAVAAQDVPIYGDGSQLRDYIHVDDVAIALVTLLSRDWSERVFNVASGTGTRMIDLARRIVDIAGAGRIVGVEWPPLARLVETGDFVADVSRIAAVAGWRPVIDLESGLTQTVAFYRAVSA